MYLEDRYGDDYIDLGYPFSISILMKNPDITYLDKMLNDKRKNMELTLNLSFTDQANKIYHQLNEHDIFKKMLEKSFDEKDQRKKSKTIMFLRKNQK